MTSAQASQVCAALEQQQWDYTHECRSGDHLVTLGLTKMDGPGMLALYGILMPDGQPLRGVTVSLQANRGIVFD